MSQSMSVIFCLFTDAHTLEMCELAVDSEVHFYDTFVFLLVFFLLSGGLLLRNQSPIYLSPMVMTPTVEIA